MPQMPTISTVTAGVDPLANDTHFGEWLKEHGVDPASISQIDVVNGEYLVVRGYARDARGAMYVQSGEAAMFKPFVVWITEPLPKGLWCRL